MQTGIRWFIKQLLIKIKTDSHRRVPDSLLPTEEINLILPEGKSERIQIDI